MLIQKLHLGQIYKFQLLETPVGTRGSRFRFNKTEKDGDNHDGHVKILRLQVQWRVERVLIRGFRAFAHHHTNVSINM